MTEEISTEIGVSLVRTVSGGGTISSPKAMVDGPPHSNGDSGDGASEIDHEVDLSENGVSRPKNRTVFKEVDGNIGFVENTCNGDALSQEFEGDGGGSLSENGHEDSKEEKAVNTVRFSEEEKAVNNVVTWEEGHSVVVPADEDVSEEEKAVNHEEEPKSFVVEENNVFIGDEGLDAVVSADEVGSEEAKAADHEEEPKSIELEKDNVFTGDEGHAEEKKAVIRKEEPKSIVSEENNDVFTRDEGHAAVVPADEEDSEDEKTTIHKVEPNSVVVVENNVFTDEEGHFAIVSADEDSLPVAESGEKAQKAGQRFRELGDSEVAVKLAEKYDEADLGHEARDERSASTLESTEPKIEMLESPNVPDVVVQEAACHVFESNLEKPRRTDPSETAMEGGEPSDSSSVVVQEVEVGELENDPERFPVREGAAGETQVETSKTYESANYEVGKAESPNSDPVSQAIGLMEQMQLPEQTIQAETNKDGYSAYDPALQKDVLNLPMPNGCADIEAVGEKMEQTELVLEKELEPKSMRSTDAVEETISSESVMTSLEHNDISVIDRDFSVNCREIKTIPSSSVGGDSVGAVAGGIEEPKRLTCYIVRVPRNPDDEKQRQIQLARFQVDEKTRIRNSINVDIRKTRASLSDFRSNLEEAKARERDAKGKLRAKRQEKDTVTATLDIIKNANSKDSITEKIQKMEHMLQHETIHLKQEKRYMAEIKRLKQQRDELLSGALSNMDAQEALDQQTQMEQRLKDLKEELDALVSEALQAESNSKSAMEKYDNESRIFNGLKDQQINAHAAWQKAYEEWSKLNGMVKKDSFRTNKQMALDLEAAGDKEGLLRHCEYQVENFMNIWNNDDEFHRQYVKSNMPSAVKRFMTMDGRLPGVDEEPAILNRNNKNISFDVVAPSSYVDSTVLVLPLKGKAGNAVPAIDSEERDMKLTSSVEGMNMKLSSSEAVERIEPSRSKKKKKKKNPSSNSSSCKAVDEGVVFVEENNLTKEEKEAQCQAEAQATKEEQMRKEKLEADLKEQLRLEQIAKSREGEERKRRKVERAQAKAEFRAQKEAELKEKRKAKKERKKPSPTEAQDYNEVSNGGASCGIRITESPPNVILQEPKVDVAAIPRKASRPLPSMKKYNKLEQPLPIPLRNRSKRKAAIYSWLIWMFLAALSLIALFLAGDFLSEFSLPSFTFL